MKILILDVNFGHSSTGRIVEGCYSHYIKNGHDVICCFGRGAVSQDSYTLKISSDLEVLFHAAASRLSGLNGLFSPLATHRLIKIIKKFKPDVVHLHDIHGYFVNYFSLINYLRASGIGVVWTFHSEFMITGNCGSSLGCDKWLHGCGSCPDPSRYPKSFYFDFSAFLFEKKLTILKDFDKLCLTSPSSWLAHRMKTSPITSSFPVHVVHNGVDTDTFIKRPCTHVRDQLNLGDKFTVLSVGSNLMSDLKGGKFVLELAKLNPDVEFLMVGVTDTIRHLPSNVKALPIVKDIVYLAELYSCANIFFIPSASESFSMVCIESLSCGVPVFGFKSGGPEEIIPQPLGKFAEYGDVVAANEILRNHINFTNFNPPSDVCREFAISNFSLEIMSSKFLNLYSTLLEK